MTDLNIENWVYTLFNKGEFTAAGDREEDMGPWCRKPGSGIIPVESLLKIQPAKFCINPLRKGAPTRSDANLTAHRSFLIEIDKDADGNLMSEADQERYIEDLGLPWSARVWTGGKSLHHLITLSEDLTAEQSDALRDRIFGTDIHNRGPIPICDFGVRLKCQVARVPFHVRNDGKYHEQLQRLTGLRGRVKFSDLNDWLTSKGFPWVPPKPKVHHHSKKDAARRLLDDPDGFHLKLPLSGKIQQLLNEGSVSGESNNRMARVAMGMASKGWNEEEMFEALRENFISQSDVEISRAIRGALRKQAEQDGE